MTINAIYLFLGILVTPILRYSRHTNNLIVDITVKNVTSPLLFTLKARQNPIISTINLWRSRSESRRQLARMEMRFLADAGITQAQRLEEISKPFWR
jgi:uncharacterized protein YjiS (DUF1127 family)